MNFDDLRGLPGRCPICACHVRLQGHRDTCPRSKCRRCKRFGRWPGSRLCLWCQHNDERRVALVAERIAQMENRIHARPYTRSAPHGAAAAHGGDPSSILGGMTAAACEGHYPRPARSPAKQDAGRVAVVCVRLGLCEITWWPTLHEAEQAVRELTPCHDRLCNGVHHIVFADARNRIRTLKGQAVKTDAPLILHAPVVQRGLRKDGTQTVLVDCPYCQHRHQHSAADVGAKTKAPCGKGLYRVVKGRPE